MKDKEKQKKVKELEEAHEILVQSGWFEGLLSTAQKVVDTIDKMETKTNSSIIAKSNIYALLGYVSSAKTMLTYSPTKKVSTKKK